MSTDISDTDRVNACLDLCRQARERFRQIEGTEWKINFSIWAFLGAIAYLSLTTAPPTKFGWASIYLLLIVPIHWRAIWRLIRSERDWQEWANYYRREARRILELPSQCTENPMPVETDNQSLRKIGCEWIVLDVALTVILAAGVIYLIW